MVREAYKQTDFDFAVVYSAHLPGRYVHRIW
ncbi:hypothetical protein [Nostoc cycadae]